jgi:DNA-directed RNA polymerase subunit A'
MVISESATLPEFLGEIPEVEVVPSTQFFWYAIPEDFDEEGNLTISITSGRFRHRWVPTTKQSAKIYLREYDDAIGIVTRGLDLFLVKLFSHDVEDVSEKYPDKIVKGLTGMVIKTPIEIIIPKGKSDDRNNELMTPFYTMGLQDRIRTEPVQEINGIQTGIMSDEDIANLAVMEVLTPDAFLDDNLITPVVNGVHDLRMGSMGKGIAQDNDCRTCGKQLLLKDAVNSCQGHFGYVELEEYIPKLLYLGTRKRKAKKNSPLIYTLNRVCHSCNHILLPDELLVPLIPKIKQQFGIGKRNSRAYSNIQSILKSPFDRYWPEGIRLPCPHCKEFSPEVHFDHGDAEFYIPVPDDRYEQSIREPGSAPIKKLSFEGVRDILADIPLDQAELLGFDTAHALPQHMFWKKFPIGPNTMRPKVEIPGKDNLDLDDLTKLYKDVIIANNQLRRVKQKKWGGSTPRKNERKLYTAVSRVTDNQVAVIGSGGTKTEYSYQGGDRAVSFEGILNRFHGKTGRFRTNLQAKYVEDVGYSTVAPNGDLAIDEVGVPIQMCMEIGIEETVTKDNYDRLRAAVLNGRNKYPGALNICLDGDARNQSDDNWMIVSTALENKVYERKGDGIVEDSYYYIDLETGEEVDCNRPPLVYAANKIQYGSIVKRHVIKDDIGLFNRAPSLHRQSVMAFRTVPLEQKCLTFNATVCDPFNADYDGDAMKFHFPQKEVAIEEAKKYMQLTNNLIHARYGKLAVANDQDQVSGIYLLTHTNKRRKGEWTRSTGLGFTNEGIPYVSKELAVRGFSTVFSLNRKTGVKRIIDSLPESDTKDGDGNPAYTGRALFSHLFTVLDCEYVSAIFEGNTPQTKEDGNILTDDNGKIVKEVVIFEKGKLIKGTLEKNAFGTGGASIAPSFIYHEGYEKGEAKLVEFIEMATRLGLAGHRMIGFTMGVADVQGGPEAQKVIDKLYDVAAAKIEAVENAWIITRLEHSQKDTMKKSGLIWTPQDSWKKKSTILQISLRGIF